MGVETIKDAKDRDHMVFDSDDFHNDDAMGDKFEDYEILQFLGGGTFGKVYKVRSKINSKIYAMKRMDFNQLKIEEGEEDGEKLAEYCKKEINVLKEMNHPKVLKYYKDFFQDNKLYLITEFVDNGDLKELIYLSTALKQPIEEEYLWTIFLESAEALKYIHKKGIIHRDIKPANIFMMENKGIKIGDLGVAKIVENNVDINSTKTSIGTCGYYSPQIPTKHYTNKADIFSLGCTFYELCHFEIPFEGQFERKPIKFNKDVYSKEMEDLINLMLEYEESKRIDIDELYERIKTICIKKYAKNTGLYSIVRCLGSFESFRNHVLKMNTNGKPITEKFLRCIQNENDMSQTINEIREVCQGNKQVSNTQEVNIKTALNFLLEKFNQEMNELNDFLEMKKTLSFQFEKIDDSKKEKALEKFNQYLNTYFKSFISENFLGKIKTVRICLNNDKKNHRIYSFQPFTYLEFDLDKIQDLKNKNPHLTAELEKRKEDIPKWLHWQWYYPVKLEKSQLTYCKECKQDANHNEFKQFWSSPNFLIIVLNRGELCQNTMEFNYSEELNLVGLGLFTDVGNSHLKYQLCGVIKRIDRDGQEQYCSFHLENKEWKFWPNEKDEKGVKMSPLDHQDGMVMMLFYSAV